MRHLNLQSISTGIALAMCIMISAPVDAQAQRRANTERTEQRGNSNRQQNNNGRRPNINSSNNPQVNNTNNNRNENKNQATIGNNRPSNDRPNQNVRPDNDRPNQNARPGNDRPNQNVRPDNDRPNQNARPGNNRPNQNVRPGNNGHNNHSANRPVPQSRPIPHIAPPRGWHPHHNAPIISGIFGINFGTLLDATLNALRHNNCNITRHTNDNIYLHNVAQLGHTWDDAIIHFEWGRMTTAQFIESSRRNNTNRYNDVYLTLSRTYETPVSMRYLNDGGYECVWYGGDRRGMVILEYYRHNNRYYTVLSFGTY